jgi:serine/threonine protein kinase
MLGRTEEGDRIPYGCEADWSVTLTEIVISSTSLTRAASCYHCLHRYSLGATVYALFTGRSPFSSGQGCAADNSLTMDGRIAWPKGIFSREAKNLITGLLERDAGARLGAGPAGWKDVMAHPFFARIDWGCVSEDRTDAGDHNIAFNVPPPLPPSTLCLAALMTPQAPRGKGAACTDYASVSNVFNSSRGAR